MSIREVHKSEFTTHDGKTLFYRHWPAARSRRRGALVLLHGEHEHSERVAHLVDELKLRDFAFFAWDARGHGRSRGACAQGDRGDRGAQGAQDARGARTDHDDQDAGVAASVRDVQCFVDHLRDVHGIAVENIAMVGQGTGAVLAATWAHDYAPPVRCLVLAAPAFHIELRMPFARAALRLMHKVRGPFQLKRHVKPARLTHDTERMASHAADPLITRAIAVKRLLDLHDTARRIVADAAAIIVPTQVLIAASDRLVRRAPQQRFYERLRSPRKERVVLRGFRHDALGELHRARALEPLRAFVLREFASRGSRVSLLHADTKGPFRAEYEALQKPPATLLGRCYWKICSLVLRAGGTLSKGLATGCERGFDSGAMLDYVYRNEARGGWGIGRLLDRAYLNAPQWRAIRQRKMQLDMLMREAMARLAREGKPLSLLDIAAGHGRHVLDALSQATEAVGTPFDRILLRDLSAVNVEAGRASLARSGLATAAHFEQADAFDEASLAGIDSRPTLALVSGVYESSGDNAMIERSLRGLAQAVQPGGYLVYTAHPWHPHREFIARAVGRQGGMNRVTRRRSQAEMDELVRRAGFRKLEQRIDEMGMFSVSLAQRDEGR